MTPVPSRQQNGGQPSRRTAVDKVVGGCVDLARVLRVDPATLRTTNAALDLLARRGVPVPLSDTAVRYAAVETDANHQATCVVGVFSSARDAEVYAHAVGWSYFHVAPYRQHPSWLAPGQL